MLTSEKTESFKVMPEASKQLLIKYIKDSIYAQVVLPYRKNTGIKHYEMSKKSNSNNLQGSFFHNFTVVYTV